MNHDNTVPNSVLETFTLWAGGSGLSTRLGIERGNATLTDTRLSTIRHVEHDANYATTTPRSRSTPMRHPERTPSCRWKARGWQSHQSNTSHHLEHIRPRTPCSANKAQKISTQSTIQTTLNLHRQKEVPIQKNPSATEPQNATRLEPTRLIVSQHSSRTRRQEDEGATLRTSRSGVRFPPGAPNIALVAQRTRVPRF